MQNKQKLVSALALITSCGMTGQALAVLPGNAILQFDDPVLGGYYNVPISGSYFSMDTNGDLTFQKTERTGITQNVGLAIGKTQLATGSHSGAADGSESPGVDNPWGFFGNTGMHQTTSPVTILSNSGNTATLDFSGWSVTWNGVADIPMGEGPSKGVATITCVVDCAEGDTYTMDYEATVPVGDPSGFGGVAYTIHFEGIVMVPPLPTVDSGVITAGSIASGLGSVDGRISFDDAGVADPSYSYGAGLLDFVVTGITNPTVAVVIPQTAPIPANSVYRKLIGGVWTEFVNDAVNKAASASSVASVCPVVNDAAYNHDNGLVAGDDCVQLIIQDGGPYDADATATNIIDPGGVATLVPVQVDLRTSGTSGCSITNSNTKAAEHADWLIVALFIGLLGWLGLRHERN